MVPEAEHNPVGDAISERTGTPLFDRVFFSGELI
jgi:hypothetical protein